MKDTVTLSVEFLQKTERLKASIKPGYWHIDPPLEVTFLLGGREVLIDMVSLEHGECVRLANSQIWYSIWFFNVKAESEKTVRVENVGLPQPT